MFVSDHFTKPKCVCFYSVMSLKRKTLNLIKHKPDLNKNFAQEASMPKTICKSLDDVVLFIRQLMKALS